ncbi:MAG: hypothetical protein ACE5OZ_01215 [Candidatus Heimdallarchaeota archaeon]
MQRTLDEFLVVTNEILEVVKDCPHCSSKIEDLNQFEDLAGSIHDTTLELHNTLQKLKEGKNRREKPKKQRSGIYVIMEDKEGNQVRSILVWNNKDMDLEKFHWNLGSYHKKKVTVKLPNGKEKSIKAIPESTTSCRFESIEETKLDENSSNLDRFLSRS